MTIHEIRQKYALLRRSYTAGAAKRQEICTELLAELRISPASVSNLNEAINKIKEALSREVKYLYIREQKLGPGVRVRKKAHPVHDNVLEEGEITAIRKDGCLQVKLDSGRSVGWSPSFAVRID